MLILTLFGTAGLATADGPIVGRAAQGRRLALLAYLALAHGRPVSRDRIVALLWPESATDRARAQLSDDLYIIRNALGEDVVRSVADELTLIPHVIRSDVGEFERLLAEGCPEAAIALVAGPLLDGFHLPDGAAFEHWLDGERARLDHASAAALEALATASEADGRLVAAVGWWQRLAALDPYSGRVALRLMRALAATGDRAGALRHARVHAALLRGEFATGPDPDVDALAEYLRLEPSRVSGTSPAPVQLDAVAPEPHGPGTGPSTGEAPAAQVPAAGAQLEASSTTDAARPSAAAPSRRAPSVWTGTLVAGGVFLMLLAVGLREFAGARGVDRAAAGSATASVGVLPFVNMGRDPADAYFGDGLAEQVIAGLSRIPGLRVAARTSSFALRDAGLDVRVIGDTLDAATVLDGSIRREGNRVRVATQLIDARTGYHIWSAEFNREVTDVLALQEEIAGAIAAALELRLPARGAPSKGRHAPDPQAYDLYLRALHLRDEMSGDATRAANELLDRAIELDPAFALAWAEKANVMGPRIYYRHVPREQGVAELRTAVSRALELDPTLGEAHVALGMLLLFFDWDWAGAEHALRRAVELNPSDPHAWHHLGNQLLVAGRVDEAVDARAQSVALDPLNARMRVNLAGDLYDAGRLDESVAQYDRARRLDPMLPQSLGLGPSPPQGAMVHVQRGRPEDAVEELVRVAALRGATAGEMNAMRAAFDREGMRGVWRRWLEMDLRHSAGAVNPMRIAILWAHIGDADQTFEWLERAHVERNPGIIFLRQERAFSSLRSDARYDRIVGAMRFPSP